MTVEWPKDFADYVFGRRAMDQFGRAMFGADWMGDEFEACMTPPLSDGAFFGEKAIRRAHALLRAHRPERPLPPLRSRVPPPIRPITDRGPHRAESTWVDPGPLHLSNEDIEQAALVVAELNIIAEPKIERREKLISEIVRAAEAAEIVVSTFDHRTGEFRDMPEQWWRSLYARKWFDSWRVSGRRPFDMPATRIGGGPEYGEVWLYLGRDRLSSFLAAVRSKRRADWWPAPGMTLKAWCFLPLVEAELARRSPEGTPLSKRRQAQVLEAMADEAGEKWTWRSIETTKAGRGH